jgi:hypothetical protein
MLRAVKLQESASGSYFNASQGVFARIDLPPTGTEIAVWAGRGAATWKIKDAQGNAGGDPGWDLVSVDGKLVVNASPANRFTANVISWQADNSPGPAANFNNNQSYAWPLVQSTSGVSGFDTNAIDLVTTDFQGDLGGGVFSLALSGDSRAVVLHFTPNRAPIAKPAEFKRPLGSPLRIEIANLLERFTTDPDGDPTALVQLEGSKNGSTITTDSNFITLTPNNNLPETITYTVQDVRPYRPGDTPRTSSSTISIDPIPGDGTASLQSYRAVEIEWQSDAGKVYQLQSRLETETEWTNQGAPVPGTGKRMSVFERASSANKFYRIIQLN